MHTHTEHTKAGIFFNLIISCCWFLLKTLCFVYVPLCVYSWAALSRSPSVWGCWPTCRAACTASTAWTAGWSAPWRLCVWSWRLWRTTSTSSRWDCHTEHHMYISRFTQKHLPNECDVTEDTTFTLYPQPVTVSDDGQQPAMHFMLHAFPFFV